MYVTINVSTNGARRIRGNLRYAITYNVFWANRNTECFEYHWLRVLAIFGVTSFPAILSGIGRHFKFWRYVNTPASETKNAHTSIRSRRCHNACWPCKRHPVKKRVDTCLQRNKMHQLVGLLSIQIKQTCMIL